MLHWIRPIREAKNGHVTDETGQKQLRVKFYSEIFL